MGYELGSQTRYKDVEKEKIVYINGTFSPELFQKTLDKFIDIYVCCQYCKLPEMEISVKNEFLQGKCTSCGSINLLPKTHKLTDFIYKNITNKNSKNMINHGGRN